MKPGLRLLIAGDVVPSGEDDFNLLSKELADYWLSADLRIINLEAPICKAGDKIVKAGPHLKISVDAIETIKKIKPSVICLANNHILDYGPGGAMETLDHLKEYNIKAIGLSPDNSTILSICDKKIGIYNVCDREFNYTDTICANIYGDKSLKEIKNLKDRCDYVIVVFHAGKERYRYPSPCLKIVCEKMVSAGADLVTTQHSHCVGCVEKYKNSTIVYGQGDFLFPENNQSPYTDTSILLEVQIHDNNNLDIKSIPLKKVVNKHISMDHSSDIDSGIRNRSEQIKDDQFVEKMFSKFSDELLEEYLKTILPISICERVLNKISKKLFKKSYILSKYGKKQELVELLNVMQCNAHRELVTRGIVNHIKKRQHGSK